jgi:hypothetical protein
MPPLPRASQLGRFAAVVSSIVIVGLYVAYRSGGQTTSPSMPGSKGGIVHLSGVTTAAATTNPTSAPISPDLMISISSKSARVFTPQVISGSKSAAVFQPSETNTLFLTTQPTTAPTRPPRPQQQQQTAAPPHPQQGSKP